MENLRTLKFKKPIEYKKSEDRGDEDGKFLGIS